MHSGKPLALFIFANSKQAYLGEIPNEGDALRQLIEPETQRLGIDLKVLGYSTLDSLLEILNTNNKRLALLHFAGHSDTDWLQLDSGKAYAAGIASKLQQCPNLQLVFLNGCNNEGLVETLVQVGIPHVIGTRQTIIDRMALAFSKGFYRALLYQAKGVSVALEQARDDVRTGYSGDFRSLDIEDPYEFSGWAWFGENQSPDWRFEDIAHECNRLPRLDETKELPTKPFKNLYYYEKADAEIFFGRCKETLKVIQALDTAAESVLLLHGGTGVGKSSFLQASLLPRLESPSRKQEVKYKRYSDLPHHTNILVEIFGTDDLAAIRALLNKKTEAGLPVIWIIDQFEEVFFDECQRSIGENGLNDADTLLTAINALYYHAEQTKPRAKIILSLRKEWMSDARDICIKYGVGITDIFLKPLERDAIVEVVESLTRTNRLQAKYHLRIEDPEEQSFANLVANELLADEASNIAPTLQIMLTRLWGCVENHQERVWNKALFQQEQREGSLLEDFLQSQLKDIAENCRSQEHSDWGRQAYESGLLLDVLYQHTSERGTASTISAEDYDRLYSHIPYRQELLQALMNRYLLIEPQTDKRNMASKETRLAHDTLAMLVGVKFDESNLPGQYAHRLISVKKKSSKSREIFISLVDLDLFLKGEMGRASWRSDEVERSIVEKGIAERVKRRRVKILLYFFPLLFVFYVFTYYFNFDKNESRRSFDELQFYYKEIKIRYEDSFRNFDLKELSDFQNKLSSLEDAHLSEKLLIVKYSYLADVSLMKSVYCYQEVAFGCRGYIEEALSYSDIGIEYIDLYSLDDGFVESSNGDSGSRYEVLLYIKLYSFALYYCLGDVIYYKRFLEIKEKIAADFLKSHTNKGDFCLYNLVNG